MSERFTEPGKINAIPHHIASVVAELHHSNTSFNIPQHAGHVARACYNLPIVHEAAATQITGMSAKLPCSLHRARFLRIQVVNGTNVI